MFACMHARQLLMSINFRKHISRATSSLASTCEPGVNVLLQPLWVMVTVRIQPPDDPSRAIACDTAVCTKRLQSSAFIPGRQFLSHQP